MGGVHGGPTPVVVTAARRVNGDGSLAPARGAEDRLRDHGCRVETLHIASLSAGWDTPFPPDHFRSGCAPIEALAEACRRIRSGVADAVTVAGRDLLRSEYAADPARRNRLMAVYGEHRPLTELYTQLALACARRWSLSRNAFRELAGHLFRNYERTRRESGDYQRPGAPWFERITELFRGVDCANPSVDFEGRLVLSSEAAARRCGLLVERPVRPLGIGLGRAAADGPEGLELDSQKFSKRRT